MKIMAYYEHLKDNKWRLCTNDPNAVGRKRLYQQVEVPPDIYRSERKTKQWLDRQLALYVDKVENGEIVKSARLTLDDFLPQWQNGYAKQNMGDYTRYMTDNMYRIYIQPVFGHMRIDKITTLQLVNFFASLKRKDGKNLSTNTKHNVYKAFKSFLDCAHKWKLIADNPIDGVDKPKASKAEKRAMKNRKSYYTRSEVESVLTALYDLPERWRLYFIGVLLGGFRRGEMLAVQWRHVDMELGGLWIEKQITFDEDGQKIEGEVKTEDSEGFIPMPNWYMNDLKRFRTVWEEEKKICKEWLGGTKQYVFHGGNGIMYFPTTPTTTWRKFLQSRELPSIRLHDL
ncbi:MAG TPA: site-specific integrase, partial [Sphingobacteriaceae bacterium]|nr:site-specific integrase [Sphingobacteriaceae bacterium]